MENEELDEIDYYEIVSLEEISKFNPTFVAFSNDEIYNNLLQFFNSDKTKANNFLNLFNEIINRQINNININNFIIVADAKRGDFMEYLVINDEFEKQEKIKSAFMLEEFVNKIKNSNKDQVKLGFKNKNKLWFPLVYDNESSRLKFKSSSVSIIELGENDNYIIFKDDERDIPIMGVYFYEPIVQLNDNLNDKIVGYLKDKREKGELKLAKDYKSFDEMIIDYKLSLPLDKIDEDEYDHLNLNNLFKKYNYDLDYISSKDFEHLKTYLQNLNKKEKKVDIKYSIIKQKPITLYNNRFQFYSYLNKTFNLIDITLKSAKKIQKDLDDIKGEKVFIEQLPIHKDLAVLIANINNDNYSEIIKNLRDIRKNLSISNCTEALENYLKINIEDVKRHFDKLESKFKLLIGIYRDLYTINFNFDKEEKEIFVGNDIKDYEGIPQQINKFKKDTIYINENDDDEFDSEDEEDKENEKLNELNKYYNNSKYKTERGFIELLKIILPFILKISERSYLDIKFDLICEHLFNFHRGIPEKFAIIRDKYRDKYDENHCKNEALKSIKLVLTSDDIDDKLKEAIKEYVNNIHLMFYDVICKWSIELQRELLDGTLIYKKDIFYPACFNLWNEYGAPYNMTAKDGILHYLICIFEDLYKDEYNNNDIDYLPPLESGFKNKIIGRLTEYYKQDLKFFDKDETKKVKENKGFEAQKKLAKFLQEKKDNYTNDDFFATFIESLVYFPSVKFKKIHKYLLGCCLEKIDNDFTNDKFFKMERNDLIKAKSRFSKDRVLNKKRLLKFYLSKIEIIEKKKSQLGIKYESLKYPIYEKSLEQWFNEFDDTTILNKQIIIEIRTKLVDTYNYHFDEIFIKQLKFKFDKDKDDIRENHFKNYRQILIGVSTILFKNLNEKALGMINQINNTIKILDKLNSIINDDNEKDIYQIQSIIVIRAICLPSFPDIKKKQSKLISSIEIDKTIFDSIITEIGKKISIIIKTGKMFNTEKQKDYIDKNREKNKNKVLEKFKNKSLEEKSILKDIKKYKIKLGDDNDNYVDDDEKKEVNKEKTDSDKDDEGEAENDIGMEDDELEDTLDKLDYGFIYA